VHQCVLDAGVMILALNQRVHRADPQYFTRAQMPLDFPDPAKPG